METMYVVYNSETARIVETKSHKRMYYKDSKVASRMCSKLNSNLIKAGAMPKFGWTDHEDYMKRINTWTTTVNMLDPEKKQIPIRKADVGGCTDPSTERYHSM